MIEQVKNKKYLAKYSGLKVPCEKYFNYYAKQELKRNNKLKDVFIKYIDLEKQCEQNNIDIPQYIQKSKSLIVEEINKRLTMSDILSVNFINNNQIPKINKTISYQNNSYYYTIDMKESNFSIYKYFTTYSFEWQDFLFGFRSQIHPYLMSSKRFRQLVMGSIDRKFLRKIETIQKQIMSLIYINLHDEVKEKIVGITADEIVFKFNSINELETIKKYISQLLIHNNLSKFKFKSEIFQFVTKEFQGEKVSYKTFIEYNDKIDNKVLFAVPKNKHWWFYKRVILNKKPNKYDLSYDNDKQIGIWIDNKLNFFDKLKIYFF